MIVNLVRIAVGSGVEPSSSNDFIFETINKPCNSNAVNN
jgi:hypothetical protein